MKKTLILASLLLSTTGLLTACGGNRDQAIANKIASISGLAMSSSTNRGLLNGKDLYNELKSPAYLYVFDHYSTIYEGESEPVTAEITWTLSNEESWKRTLLTAPQWKFTPTYPALGNEAVACVLTGTVNYNGKTAQAIYNITLLAKTK